METQMNPNRLLPVLALILLGLATTLEANEKTKEVNIVNAAKPAVDAGTPDISSVDPKAAGRENLQKILAQINKSFREQAPGVKEDLKFEVFYATKKPDAAAMVLNTLPAFNGRPPVRFITFFIRQPDGGWMLVPDSFEQ